MCNDDVKVLVYAKNNKKVLIMTDSVWGLLNEKRL